MKVCFLHYSYPGIGGTESVTNLLSEQFVFSGHEVFVLAWKHPDCSIQSSLKVNYLPDKNSINSLENADYIYDYCKKNNIDVLINQGPFWIPKKEKSTCKTVIISVLHYSPSFKIANQRHAIVEEFKKKSSTLSHFIKSTFRYIAKDFFAKRDFNKIFKQEIIDTIENSDAFVVLCDEYINELQLLLKRKYNNLYAIENGLPLTSEVCGDKQKTVLFIGRLTQWDKRVDRLLKVWGKIQNKFPEWNLKILGDGPERENLESLANNLNLQNYEFCGFVPVKKFLHEASIIAMTSSSEGFPMVILEAANYGVVPIAYNVCEGISHIIKNEYNGILVEPFLESQYIKELSSLMIDKSKLSVLSENAKTAVGQYSVEKVSEKWLLLIHSLCNKKK